MFTLCWSKVKVDRRVEVDDENCNFLSDWSMMDTSRKCANDWLILVCYVAGLGLCKFTYLHYIYIYNISEISGQCSHVIHLSMFHSFIGAMFDARWLTAAPINLNINATFYRITDDHIEYTVFDFSHKPKTRSGLKMTMSMQVPPYCIPTVYSKFLRGTLFLFSRYLLHVSLISIHCHLHLF